MRKPFTLLAILIFAVIALVHLLRLVFGWQAIINGVTVPMWVSVPGIVIAGALAVALWWESRR